MWMSLQSIPSWEYIEETCIYLKNKNVDFNDIEFFNQTILLKKNC